MLITSVLAKSSLVFYFNSICFIISALSTLSLVVNDNASKYYSISMLKKALTEYIKKSFLTELQKNRAR